MPDTPATGRYGFFSWCLKAIGLILIAGLGAGYGISAYQLFVGMFSTAGRSGVMLASFLAGVPFVIGLVVGHLARRRRLTGLGGASAMSMLSVSLFAFAGGALLREGTICILMAIPLFLLMAVVGALVGWAASRLDASDPRPGPRLMGAALLLPLAIAPAEQLVEPDSAYQRVERRVHIAAAPATVWQLINHPQAIRPEELDTGWAYRIGVPYPIEAHTLEPRVGGLRALRWERGVSFEERITEWVPERRIAWTYRFDAGSFPPGSLDDHIVIGGRYFGLDDTSYTLTPADGGTDLSISVGTHVTTTFNGYAGWWAAFLVDDTAQAILHFYKTRAEQPAR